MPVSQSKVTKILDLSVFDGWDSLDDSVRDEVREEVSNYLVEEILSSVGSAETTVEGGEYKKELSEAYKELKKGQSSKPIANMELTGDMLDALEYKLKGKSKIEVGIFDSDEAPKAYNHNVGDTLPKRQFIPMPSKDFRQDIREEIQKIINEYSGE